MLPKTRWQLSAGWREVSFRTFQAVAILSAYATWLFTQQLLESTRPLVDGFTDHAHELLSPINVLLNAHPTFADAVLAVSSLEVDLAALSMVAFFFMRRQSRPLLALWFILVARQLCQASISIPAPEGMIWRYPGFPSIMVTYHTSTDFFFSGHMALATVVAAELTAQRAPGWKQGVAWTTVAIQAVVILSMRFHYTTDVVAGFFAAIVATQLAGALGPRLDERFGPLARVAAEARLPASNLLDVTSHPTPGGAVRIAPADARGGVADARV